MVESDEHVGFSTFKAVREYLKTDSHPLNHVLCLRLETHDEDGTTIDTCYRPRFWRADQGIRYTGRIFETLVSPSELEYVHRDDLCIALRPPPEGEETVHPIQRRLQTILNLEIAENGLSGRLRHNLGLQALLDADHSAAIEHFEHIIDEETDTHQVASAYVMLCETLRKAGRPKDAVHRGLMEPSVSVITGFGSLLVALRWKPN